MGLLEKENEENLDEGLSYGDDGDSTKQKKRFSPIEVAKALRIIRETDRTLSKLNLSFKGEAGILASLKDESLPQSEQDMVKNFLVARRTEISSLSRSVSDNIKKLREYSDIDFDQAFIQRDKELLERASELGDTKIAEKQRRYLRLIESCLTERLEISSSYLKQKLTDSL